MGFEYLSVFIVTLISVFVKSGFWADSYRTSISGIERGVRNVALRNIEALSQALEVSLAELFRGL